jgi:hypothetical protein
MEAAKRIAGAISGVFPAVAKSSSLVKKARNTPGERFDEAHRASPSNE